MDFRTDESCTLKINLGFNSHDVIDTKENSIHCYRLQDLYFHKHKLAIEVDELGHADRNLNNETHRQKALERELDWVFNRINPHEKDFNIFKEINKIHRHIKKSTKKSLIHWISKRLLELEFKKHNAIKSKCLKWIDKNILTNNKK